MTISEAEVHWGAFLESLQARGMRGVEHVVSDDHAGLLAARRAVLGGATWQRCQFHLARNAIHCAPNATIRKRIGTELREVWKAGSLAKAETALAELIDSCRQAAPKLVAWLEENARGSRCLLPAGAPPPAPARLKSDGARRAAGTQAADEQVRVFSNEGSPERLVSAVLVETDDKSATDTLAHIA